MKHSRHLVILEIFALKIFVLKIFVLKFCTLQKFNLHSTTYYMCWKYFVCSIFIPFGEYKNYLINKNFSNYSMSRLRSLTSSELCMRWAYSGNASSENVPSFYRSFAGLSAIGKMGITQKMMKTHAKRTVLTLCSSQSSELYHAVASHLYSHQINTILYVSHNYCSREKCIDIWCCFSCLLQHI